MGSITDLPPCCPGQKALLVNRLCIIAVVASLWLPLDWATAHEPAPGASAAPATAEATTEAGFAGWVSRGYTPLFNGQDLAGWRNPYKHGEAKVVDGEIHLLADNKFFLVTEREYADFRLVGEIHLPDGKANSGFMFRCHVQPGKVFGYQAECDGSDRRWSAGLYDEGRRGWVWPSQKGRSPVEMLSYETESKAHFDQPHIRDALQRNGWNQYVVECRGSHITIELNGVKVTEIDDSTDAKGFIGIQHHGEDGQVYRFRNIFIKELPEIPAEENCQLIQEDPVSVSSLGGGNFLVDFGRVAFGNISLTPPEGKPVDVTVSFGEKLTDQRIDRQPPGTVRFATVEATLAGSQPIRVAPSADARNIEQVSPKHPPAVLTPADWGVVTPFRWVEVDGWPGELKPEQIVRHAAFSKSWDDNAAAFECSDETLNRIWDLCRYSIRATTFAGVYVDGDRERIPYEADAYLNQLSHYATDRDVDFARRTFDWLMAYGTWPTEWASHMVFMAAADYQHTGDSTWLGHRYESLKDKMLAHRVGEDGLVHSNKAQQSKDDIVDWPQKERDGFEFREINTVVNAFHLATLRQMSALAGALGKQSERDEFEAQFEQRLTAFQSQLFDPSVGLYRDGVGSDHHSLHANLFPLAFGLVPAAAQPKLVAWLTARGMRCSVYAAQYFLEGLFAAGGDEAAVALMLADNDRSWKHMANSGTTITWEAWDQKYKPNQDWNHAWGAAPANLLPRFVLGVQASQPGWESALIQPRLSGLTHAKGKVPTPRGPIQVAWQRAPQFSLQVSLPAGVTATVVLPSDVGQRSVLVNGKPQSASQQADGWHLDEAIAGQAKISLP